MSIVFDKLMILDVLARIMVEECEDVSSKEEAREFLIKSGVMDQVGENEAAKDNL